MTPPCFTWPRSCKIVVRELVLRGSAPGSLVRGDRPADYGRDLVGREVPQARQRGRSRCRCRTVARASVMPLAPHTNHPSRCRPWRAVRHRGSCLGCLSSGTAELLPSEDSAVETAYAAYADSVAVTPYHRATRSNGTRAILPMRKK